MRRAIVIVLDSVGIGEMPDADLFGDIGSNTLGNILNTVPVSLPNLQRLGLGNLLSHPQLPAVPEPEAVVTRMATQSPGKDTLTGHWEMMGYPQAEPFPTYPNGFPDCVVDLIRRISGRTVLGNVVASGTEIIRQLGQEQTSTAGLIVYTSADSVLQLAAHEEVVPVEELHAICANVHTAMLSSAYKVARVIARPFTGEFPFRRTARRRDFTVKPGHTVLNTVAESGADVLAVGKIADIFAGSGISQRFKTEDNDHGIAETLRLIEAGQGSLLFVNLVDFDMLYGHRNDPIGYAKALEQFDRAVPALLSALHHEDLLIITADHGCDPTTSSTDHSREYVPCIAYRCNGSPGKRIADRETLCDIGATVADWLGLPVPGCGQSFLAEL